MAEREDTVQSADETVVSRERKSDESRMGKAEDRNKNLGRKEEDTGRIASDKDTNE